MMQLLLLAQNATSTDLVAWGSVVSSIVNWGFQALVAWWLLTKYLPQRDKDFLAALDGERQIALTSELRRASESKEKMNVLVDTHKEALVKVIEHCERESTRRDAAMAVVDKSLINVGEVLENVRGALMQNATVIQGVMNNNRQSRRGTGQ